MPQRLAIKIRGRVQGVFFRDSAAKVARQLNLTGFVRNELDGSVYIEAEGEQANLGELTEWCKRGPEMAHVESVKTEVIKPTGGSKFDIF